MKRTITIFGSSLPPEGSPEYREAYRLASLLARRGFDICSGGYSGIMDAVSKGASENGSRAVGITLKNRPNGKSGFLTEEVICDSLFERISKLIEKGDGYIILTGGTGTLLELASIWEMMNKGIIAVKPAACYSSMWKNIVGIMEEQIGREGREKGLIKVFKTPDEIADYFVKIFSI